MIYCTGRNHSHSFRNAKFYIQKASGTYVIPKSTSDLKELLYKKKIVKRHHIDGGPACFGDSGGPLWREVVDSKTGTKIPVIVGVFSFTLWGTCHGSQEPAYYGQVSSFTDWIYRYVPKIDTCSYSDRFHDRRQKKPNRNIDLELR